MSDGEAAAFRAYLQKGGFAVFEDFDGASQWANFETQMRRVLPDARFARLDGTECDYINATPTDLDLAIRRARMIDEAGDVRGDVAVDHGRIARPEEILAAVQLHLSGRGGTSDIFDDARALPNALLSEKAPAAVRPVDGNTKGCRHEALLHWAR